MLRKTKGNARKGDWECRGRDTVLITVVRVGLIEMISSKDFKG